MVKAVYICFYPFSVPTKVVRGGGGGGGGGIADRGR